MTTNPTGTHKITLMTAKEAAAYLRVSISTLYRMEKRGELIPFRIPGGHRRYSLASLNGCLSTEREKAETA